ncbi:hypothetical protein Plhal304r1_c085g0169051 [Plasmopara halstedii]
MYFVVEDLEEVDYESDTPITGWGDKEGEVLQQRDVSSARTLRGIISNRLDEAQEQQLDAAHRAASMRSYAHSVLGFRVIYGFRSADPATEAKDAITRLSGVYVLKH